MTDSDLYRSPTALADYRPRSTSTDSIDHAATVDARTRASIAAKSWLLSAPTPRATRTTVPPGSPYSDGGWS